MKESLCEKENSWREMVCVFVERILMERNLELNVDEIVGKKVNNFVFIIRNRDIVGGGIEVVLNVLVGYLRYLEGIS